jgi:hypothetical protein
MRKNELEKIWKQLDGACEALDKLSYDTAGLKLLDEHEKWVNLSAINSLKNDIEKLINSKSRKKEEVE